MFGADMRAAIGQLEDYRGKHGSYPIACDAISLSKQLPTPNIFAGTGQIWLYCSDGQKYVTTLMPLATTEYSGAYGAPLVASNNRLVSAPVAVRERERALGQLP
jgi:hypothetical protein